jgi:hypothetical protein
LVDQTAIQIAASGATFSVMSFVFGIVVHKEHETGQYKFFMHNKFTKFYKAMIALVINALIGLAIEKWLVEPYVMSLYSAHIDKIGQFALVGVIGLVTSTWYHVGLTKSKKARAIWGLLCVLCAFLLFEGLRVLPLW